MSKSKNNENVKHWRVNESELGTPREVLGEGQAEVVVHRGQDYTFLCYCGARTAGDLKKADIASDYVNCPRGHVSLPLAALASGDSKVYRFIPVEPKRD